MKLRSLLPKLMILVAVFLLIACFATGMQQKTNESSVQSFLWILTLAIFIGAVAFHISNAAKPLDWVLVGSFIGTCISLGEVLGISNGGFPAVLFLCLFLTELILSAAYRIGRRFHNFD
jgi:hypothetical protein